MSLNDPISDMLTRVRNAAAAGHATVQIPHSRLKAEIARILKREGFISDFSVEEEGSRSYLRLRLKYGRADRAVIRGLSRVSRPGLRKYVGSEEIPKVFGGIGMAILSTSRGLLTDREARRSKVGGEVVCYVW
ncbi:MAG TPA: 30S ribosomal protein S8 [Kiritimatiellia bacterium]|mgnify:FL=1|nr:30S ribosomal protein S8 [Kiritimatiellia bacterium]HMO98836.1 30S ribosomal protein S8 [Kiritimatiellia bacterium]